MPAEIHEMVRGESSGRICAPPRDTWKQPRFWTTAVEWTNRVRCMESAPVSVSPNSQTARPSGSRTEMERSAAPHCADGRAAKAVAYPRADVGAGRAQPVERARIVSTVSDGRRRDAG